MVNCKNQKNKGNSFELKAAKILTRISGRQWFRVGVTSGARGTTQGIKSQTGDVRSDDPYYNNYVIEAKKTQKMVTIYDLLENRGYLKDWIDQAKREAGQCPWILIFAIDYQSNAIMVSSSSDNITKLFKTDPPEIIEIIFEKRTLYFTSVSTKIT